MKKLLFGFLLFCGFYGNAWATFPTTGILYSGNTTYCTGLTITILVSGGGITGGSLQSGGTSCPTDTVVYVTGGTNGTFKVTASSGGVASAVALNSAGTGYSAGSSRSTYVPLNQALFTQYGANSLTVVNNQIVGTAASSALNGATWNKTFTQPEMYLTFYNRLLATSDQLYGYINFNTATTSGYNFQVFRNTGSNDSTTMHKETNGSQTTIGSSFTHTYVNGDSVGMSSISGTETLWYRPVDKFTVTSANATLGAVYQDGNGVNYTVATTIAGSTTLTVQGQSALSTYSGTLTKQSGTGDSTITFSAFTKGAWTSEETASESTYTTGVIGFITLYGTTSPGITNFGGGTQVTTNDFVELTNESFSGQTAQGIFKPGGNINLTGTVTAVNGTATTVSGTLASSDSCITVNAATETFSASIGAGVSASNATPFNFSISSGCASGHLSELTLTLAATTGTGWTPQAIPIWIYVNTPIPPVIAPTYTCVTNYYVSMYGQDGDTGATMGHAWATMTNALNTLLNASATQPGVCINVEAGLYTILPQSIYLPGNYVYGLGGVVAGVQPSASQYLVARSAFIHGATELPDPTEDSIQATASFTFDDANAVVIDGFALAGQALSASYPCYESGTSFNSYLATVPGSYITNINNIVFNHCGAGLATNHTDDIVQEGNIVSGNSSLNPYQDSGITNYQATNAASGDVSAGYHNYITNNVSFNNVIGPLVVYSYGHTDGEGIIIDDFQNTQNGSTFGNYVYKTLVQNNIVFGNGGAGIQINYSDYVTISNNTAYDDFIDTLNQGTNARGEIKNQNGENAIVDNNIAYSVPGSGTTQYNVAYFDGSFTATENTGSVWYNNLSFNGTIGQASTQLINTTSTIDTSTGNILGQNPIYASIANYDFSIPFGSPGMGSGTSAYAYPSTDIVGHTTNPNNIWMGAYQYPLTLSGTVYY